MTIITITGPRSVGKTTISKLVAKKLKLRYVSSDEIGDKYFKKQGGLDKMIKAGNIIDFIKKNGYPLIIKEYAKDNFVFDLSGGSFTSEKTLRACKKVRKTAKKNGKVVGLLPYKSMKKSVEILFERERNRHHFKEMTEKELLAQTKKSYSKYPKIMKANCNIIIYTENKKPEIIAKEIVNNLKKN